MVSWLFLTSVACDHAYHVKAVPALADDNRTVVARELAFATGAFEVYTADTACVVGLFGQIPFPGGHGAEGVDGDFHGSDCDDILNLVSLVSFRCFVSDGVSKFKLLSCIANTFHLQQLAMFILCPNGDGPPADGAQQQKRGCVARVGAIDVRELQQLQSQPKQLEKC